MLRMLNCGGSIAARPSRKTSREARRKGKFTSYDVGEELEVNKY
jgi:hypothetical protein